MADGDRQIPPFCPNSSGHRDPVPPARPAFPLWFETSSLFSGVGSSETDTAPEDTSSETSSDATPQGGVGAPLSIVPSGCPIPGGLWRVLSTMGLLPEGAREAELILYVSTHHPFDTCPPTETHVTVPSLGGSSDAFRFGDREDYVEENSSGGSDPTTLLCSSSEVEERPEDRHVGDRVGGVVPGGGAADATTDRAASLEVHPQVDPHVAVQMAELVLRTCHCVVCLEPLDDAPPMVTGPPAICYSLFQELFIHEVTWLTLPCCHQYMHAVCAVLNFMGKNRWSCPYCRTVLVDDLYGPLKHVHLHGQSTTYAKVQSLRGALMDELPRVLDDEHLIPFLSMGAVRLSDQS